jgi:hypothetical protein
MDIYTKIKNGKLSIDMESNLAILNNFSPKCEAYKKAYEVVKLEAIKFLKDNFIDGRDYDDIDIRIEIMGIVEMYNNECQ